MLGDEPKCPTFLAAVKSRISYDESGNDPSTESLVLEMSASSEVGAKVYTLKVAHQVASNQEANPEVHDLSPLPKVRPNLEVTAPSRNTVCKVYMQK